MVTEELPKPWCEGTLRGAPKTLVSARGVPKPERAKASADLMLGSMGIPGAWDSGGAQA